MKRSRSRSSRQAADVAAVERAAQLAPAPAAASASGSRRSCVGDAPPAPLPGAPPTVEAVLAHPIMALAQSTWAAAPSEGLGAKPAAFDPALVQRIFREEIPLLPRGGSTAGAGAGGEGDNEHDSTGDGAARDALGMLELSSYLEHYLWPHYDGSAGVAPPSEAHVLSIVLMVNAKCEAGMPAWPCFTARPKHFGHFVAAVLDAATAVAAQASGGAGRASQAGEDEVAARRVLLTLFLVNAYQSLEQPLVRAHFLPLLSLPLWRCVSPARVRAQLSAFPQLKRHWAHTGAVHKAAAGAVAKAEAALAAKIGRMGGAKGTPKKKKAKQGGGGASTAAAEAQRAVGTARALLRRREREGNFFWEQLRAFFALLEATPASSANPASRERRLRLLYFERFAELLVDLLAQLPTRRYLLLLLLDSHVVPRCRAAPLLAALGDADNGDGDTVEELGGALGGGADGGAEGALFRKLVSRLAFYQRFEIAEQTGQHTTARQVSIAHYERMLRAQRVAFAMTDEEGGDAGLGVAERAALRRFSMSAIGRVSSAAQLRSTGGGHAMKKSAASGLGALSARALRALCAELQLLPPVSSSTEIAGDTCGDAAATWANGKQTRLLSLASDALCARPRTIDQINDLPLYPTETLLWDPNLLPLDSFGSKAGGAGTPAHGGGGAVLALPKLNLQFLTLTDYLLRNWTLYRLEAAHEIREDLVDAIERAGGSCGGDSSGGISWAGWSRMALPISGFDVTEVGLPQVGDTKPSKVRAELSFSLDGWRRKGGAAAASARREWDELREHDVVFMVALSPPPVELAVGREKLGNDGQQGPPRVSRQERDEARQQFPQRRGVLSVRGAEVLELRDEAGKSMNDPAALAAARRGGQHPDAGRDADMPGVGSHRTLVLKLDEAQYAADMASGIGSVLYDGTGQRQAAGGLNLLVRRRGKENNFRAVLQTIRDLMNAAEVEGTLPPWLHDVFLGYGHPASASPPCIEDAAAGSEDTDDESEEEDAGGSGAFGSAAAAVEELDFRDTFVSAEHVLASFPGQRLSFAVEEAGGEGADGQQRAATVRALAKGEVPPPPPYRIAFGKATLGKKAALDGAAEVCVTSYAPPHPGPFPQDQPRRNPIAFTPTQLLGIRAGMSTGLTLVVGPPGTGKTDVAVQVIANLYAAHPTQRIVLVTHSNQALNDLFAKLLQRDVDPRHMIRLGAGERQLREDLGEDFSKRGRVDYALMRRLELLGEVGRLARSLTNPAVSEMEWAADDDAATCEAAEHFRLYHVQARIERFEQEMTALAAAGVGAGGAEAVAGAFPFMHFFSTATYPRPLFEGATAAADPRAAALELARGCFRHLHRVFEELTDCRAFELLRSQVRQWHVRTHWFWCCVAPCSHTLFSHPVLARTFMPGCYHLSSGAEVRFPLHEAGPHRGYDLYPCRLGALAIARPWFHIRHADYGGGGSGPGDRDVRSACAAKFRPHCTRWLPAEACGADRRPPSAATRG